MLGEIKRHIRDDGQIKVSRTIKEMAIKIRELEKEYLRKGKEITIFEIAEELNVSKEEVALAMESSNCVDSFEGTTFTNPKDGNTVSLLDRISNNIDEEELIANRLTVKKLIENLSTRDKEIILLRFYKEKTQTQVAKILGVTQVQVSRLERKILGEMKNELKEKTNSNT